ncbi:MAG: methionyl-tRNA formyltransferase [Deltaproteobacteria bacterium]|jgi:methionyl-tRNA formyltransferase|nr:methionyl-tRNA formyltransferase [Deltaproteobacteria bacterium]
MFATNKSDPLRIVFFGSGQFAIPALEALAKGPDKLVLVVSSPPAPSGRGRTITPTPVSTAARKMSFPVLETESVNSFDTLEAIERARPDQLVVASFRGFLGSKLLETGFTPPLNIHPSLLPKHRGPAPVNWTLIEGDELCGVSVCFMELKIDSGPVVAQKSLPIPEGIGAGALEAILAQEGATLLLDSIAKLKTDTLQSKPQNEQQSTINRLMTKKDGRIDFSRPARQLANLINGVDPWPGAQVTAEGKIFKLYGARAWEGAGTPGQILGLSPESRLKVGTAEGILTIDELQPEGRIRLSASEFIQGYRFTAFDSSI